MTIQQQQQGEWVSWIDTHSHIFTEEFDDDRAAVMQRARDAGVGAILLPNLDDESIESLLRTTQESAGLCHAMLGLHPSYVDASYRAKLEVIVEALQVTSVVAIGEIGLDYYWSQEFRNEMNEALRIQLRWAAERSLPVSLHTRSATYDTIKAINEINSEGTGTLRGIFHSFTGDATELEAILEVPNFSVGINGVVTFKNCAFRSFLPELLPLDRLVIETDAPYLSPTPYRGKRNEPAYIVQIAQHLAELYQVPIDSLQKQLYKNSSAIFEI